MDDSTPDPTRQTDRMNRADLLSGIVFTLLGLAIVYFSWVMPRLEIRGIHPSTIPGIVPGLLGGLLTICGILLGAKAFAATRGVSGWSDFFSLFTSPQAGRFGVVAALTQGYSLVLVGLVPFWLATALFVFAFIVVFEAWLADTPKPLARAALWAAVQAVVVAATVTLVFQYGFLVRLP